MIRIRQIKINVEVNQEEYLTKKILKLLNISKINSFKIVKKSLDARNKSNLFYVYEVDVSVSNEEHILRKNKSSDIIETPVEKYIFKITGQKELPSRPIIIGSGPAGLFCAYLLAESGYKPIIYERGERVEDRVKSIEKFWETNELNTESNVQFGEGGAGTFSDGKLNTMVKDKEFRGKKAFEIFVSNGAPEEIMYLSKPHIGTDLLRKVIINMRNKIILNGGEIHYNKKLTNIEISNNELKSITLNNEETITCSNLILAIGHSARDTFKMLLEKNISMQAKPFAVGVRIEHKQSMINESQYGKNYKNLEPASYKLTYTTKDKRGVYSFCMCPGGYVVNASSEKGLLAINGMSNYKRDTGNANSALVVTVSPKDFGNDPLSGMNFQRELESLAYKKGQGNIPIQTYKDFKLNQISTTYNSINPIVKGKYTFTDLNEIFPKYITDSLKEAIPEFGKKIKGFDNPDALMLGVESRTSSPIKILRDAELLSNVKGLYPCGEGAGYAGGITSAAIDGMKVAEQLAKIYLPITKN